MLLRHQYVVQKGGGAIAEKSCLRYVLSFQREQLRCQLWCSSWGFTVFDKR